MKNRNNNPTIILFFLFLFSQFFLYLFSLHIELQGTITTILIGLLLFAWGLVTIVLPIYEFVLVERLRMQPGLPPFEEWVKPSPEVLLSVYIFSVENPYTFLNGTDEKLKLIEIGPIVYKEHLHHQNVEFHENSTLSYTAHRTLEFLEDRNEPDILNRVILVPNFVLLVRIFSFSEYEREFLNMTIIESTIRHDCSKIFTQEIRFFRFFVKHFFWP